MRTVRGRWRRNCTHVVHGHAHAHGLGHVHDYHGDYIEGLYVLHRSLAAMIYRLNSQIRYNLHHNNTRNYNNITSSLQSLVSEFIFHFRVYRALNCIPYVFFEEYIFVQYYFLFLKCLNVSIKSSVMFKNFK